MSEKESHQQVVARPKGIGHIVRGCIPSGRLACQTGTRSDVCGKDTRKIHI